MSRRITVATGALVLLTATGHAQRTGPNTGSASGPQDRKPATWVRCAQREYLAGRLPLLLDTVCDWNSQQLWPIARGLTAGGLEGARDLLQLLQAPHEPRAETAMRLLVVMQAEEALLRALHHRRPEVRERARRGVDALGPAVLPALLGELRARGRIDPRQPPLSADNLQRQSRALQDPEPGVRLLALESLKRLGPPAWPHLAQLLAEGEPVLRLEAVRFLISEGRLGVACLGRAWARTDGRSLRLLLPSLEKRREMTIRRLTSAWSANDPDSFGVSTEILSQLGAWQALAEGLRLDAPRLTRRLESVLTEAGSASVHALLVESSAGHPRSRRLCVSLLHQLGPEAVPGLIQLLGDPVHRAAAGKMLSSLTDLAGPGR